MCLSLFTTSTANEVVTDSKHHDRAKVSVTDRGCTGDEFGKAWQRLIIPSRTAKAFAGAYVRVSAAGVVAPSRRPQHASRYANLQVAIRSYPPCVTTVPSAARYAHGGHACIVAAMRSIRSKLSILLSQFN